MIHACAVIAGLQFANQSLWYPVEPRPWAVSTCAPQAGLTLRLRLMRSGGRTQRLFLRWQAAF